MEKKQLTAAERLENIRQGLAEHSDDCRSRRCGKCDCGADAFQDPDYFKKVGAKAVAKARTRQ